MSEKKGDDEMINKKEASIRTVPASNDQAMSAAAQQFNKYRKTFKKLAKN